MNDPEYFRNGPKETDGQLEIRLKINGKTGITTLKNTIGIIGITETGHRPMSLGMQLQA